MKIIITETQLKNVILRERNVEKLETTPKSDECTTNSPKQWNKVNYTLDDVKNGSIINFGDIDTKEGMHPKYTPFYNVRKKDSRLFGEKGLDIDMETGKLQIGNQYLILSQLGLRNNTKMEMKNYYKDSGYQFELLEQARFGALMDKNIAKSVFNQLFLRHMYLQKYFNPVVLNSPYYQLWEVRGDSISTSGSSGN